MDRRHRLRASTRAGARLLRGDPPLLAGLPDGALAPDYTGIRPKLAPAGRAGDRLPDRGAGGPRRAGLVNLFGIESPGLTASLAIAEEVLAAAA